MILTMTWSTRSGCFETMKRAIEVWMKLTFLQLFVGAANQRYICKSITEDIFKLVKYTVELNSSLRFISIISFIHGEIRVGLNQFLEKWWSKKEVKCGCRRGSGISIEWGVAALEKLLLLKGMKGINVVVMVFEEWSFISWDGAGVAEFLMRVWREMGFVRDGGWRRRRLQPGHVIAPVKVGDCINPSVFYGSHVISSSSFFLSACGGKLNQFAIGIHFFVSFAIEREK